MIPCSRMLIVAVVNRHHLTAACMLGVDKYVLDVCFPCNRIVNESHLTAEYALCTQQRLRQLLDLCQ